MLYQTAGEGECWLWTALSMFRYSVKSS